MIKVELAGDILEKQIARYKRIDTSPRFLAMDLQRQLLPGTFEHAMPCKSLLTLNKTGIFLLLEDIEYSNYKLIVP